MKTRETISQRGQGVEYHKQAQGVPPIMLHGLNMLSGLTPKAKLPTGFSTSKIFEGKPLTSTREKSKHHPSKVSASNLHTCTDSSLQMNLGLIKSRSPTGAANTLKNETASKSRIFGRTAKKKSDPTQGYFKSTLPVAAAIINKMVEDGKNLNGVPRANEIRADLQTQSSMLGNSLYGALSPNATSSLLKDGWGLLSDSNIHNGSLRVLNTMTKQTSLISDYDWVEPSQDRLTTALKVGKKFTKPQSRGKKHSIHSIEQSGGAINKIAFGLNPVDHHRNGSTRVFDGLYQKSTTSKCCPDSGLDKTQQKSQTRTSKQAPIMRQKQPNVYTVKSEFPVSRMQGSPASNVKRNRGLVKQLSIENVGSVCGSSVGKNSKRSLDLRRTPQVGSVVHHKMGNHSQSKRLLATQSNKTLLETNLIHRLDCEMPLDLMGFTKKKLAGGRIKRQPSDLSKLRTLPTNNKTNN